MRSGLEIDIDADQVLALADQIDATPEQLAAALRSTYARMGRWLRTQGVRGLASRLQIQQKTLRGRVRSYRMQGGVGSAGEGAKVWFGLRPIPFTQLRPRPAPSKRHPKGIRAEGGRYVAGAFVATVRGRARIFVRQGEDRLPLRAVVADIDDAATTFIEDELIGTEAFDAQFYRFLEHELKWRTRTSS